MTDKHNRPKQRTVKGFKDSLWVESLFRRSMLQSIRSVFENYGFLPLETPALEYVDVLGKFLPDSTEVEEGLFAFESEEEWVALRYDLTAPLSRVVAQYQDLPVPFRRYQVGRVWRREKPGLGRFREFTQFDIDTVGSSLMLADCEVCAALVDALLVLGIKQDDFEIRISNRKIINGVLELAGINQTDSKGNPNEQYLRVLRSIDKIDRLGTDGVLQLLLHGRIDKSGDMTEGAFLTKEQWENILWFFESPRNSRKEVLSYLLDSMKNSSVGMEGVEELTEIDSLLSTMGYDDTSIIFDPLLVRGMSYYTGPVFEAYLKIEFKDEKGRKREFGSIAGGGRYDDLIGRFKGQKVPATGISIGIDRLLAALMYMKPESPPFWRSPVVVTVMDNDRINDYLKITSELREADISAEMFLGTGGFQKQMKYADKRGALIAIIAGSDEFDNNTITIKDLMLGRELSKDLSDRKDWLSEQPSQVTVPRSDLIKTVKEIISRYK